MNKKRWIIALAAFVVAIVSLTSWQCRMVNYLAVANESQEFELRCDFARFRQILVRKNATEAIINHGGMKLLSERIQDVEVDATKDERPLLNALRGISKTDVDATKNLTVQLDQAGLRAEQLTLRQQVRIREDNLAVETASVGPQDDVMDYVTNLSASADGDATKIAISIKMEIEVRVPKLFRSRADLAVRRVAADTLAAQQVAITKLIVEHADELFVLPDLSRD